MTKVKDDPINPSYYEVGGMSTYDFVRAKELSYPAGLIVKYIVRYKYKNGMEDLKKAKWFLDKLIEEENLTAMEYVD